MSDEMDTQQSVEEQPQEDAATLTIKKLRQERNQFQQQLKEYQSKFADIDVDEYHTLRKAVKEGAKNEEALKLTYENQVRAKATEVDAWKNKYEGLVVENQVRAAFAKAGGRENPGSGMSYDDLVLAVVKSRLRLNEGKLEVLDENGHPDFDDKGEPLTLDKLMLRLKKEGATSACFKPENTNAGTGANPNVSRGMYFGKSKEQIAAEIKADRSLTPMQKVERASQLGIN